MPLETGHLRRYGIMVGSQNFLHLLGIKASTERGRFDEVDKHHGQLSPLSGWLASRLVDVGGFGGRVMFPLGALQSLEGEELDGQRP